MNNFQSADYRKALGTFATGITVITAVGENGELAGLTANSFTSVSLEPPLILWCLAKSSENLALFRTAPRFAVNILAADQKHISDHFARRQKDKFISVGYRTGIGGTPLLHGCVCWLQCHMVNQYPAGDHLIFIGEVEQLETSGKEALLYHQGNYSMSLPLPDNTGNQDIAPEQIEGARPNLYSLLVGAIHSYQERFEASQQQLVDSVYEARLLVLLNDTGGHDTGELSRKIQIPRAETESILADMRGRGLLNVSGGNVVLTAAGQEKAARLLMLARQHEADALALLGNLHVDTFRNNLLRLIGWNRAQAKDE